ncbi:MAG: helix-turn-helix domain-containing protein [Ilumatobacteraceae bacterium]
MKRKSYSDMNCSVAQSLDIVGDPWTLLVVRDIMFGIRRFNDIQERLGIARNTLTDRLTTLVDHGVLAKVAYQDNPERFEYRLTPKGRALSPIIITLMQWGDQWSGLPEPPVHLIDRNSGRILDPVLVDRQSGRPLEQLRVQAIGETVRPNSTGSQREDLELR